MYHSLACTFNSNGKFGRGLKNCKLAFKCLEASQIFSVESDVKKGNKLDLLYSDHVLCFRQKYTENENGFLFTFFGLAHDVGVQIKISKNRTKICFRNAVIRRLLIFSLQMSTIL